MQLDHVSMRKERTRTLIQLGGLMDKAGLLENFDIALGRDLQKDAELKTPVSALMGALLELKQIMTQDALPFSLLAEKGARALGDGDEKADG